MAWPFIGFVRIQSSLILVRENADSRNLALLLDEERKAHLATKKKLYLFIR